MSFFATPVQSQSVEELKQLIDEQNTAIERLSKEEQAVAAELETIGKQANTLENEKKRIEATRKQVQNSINSTQTKIKATELTISRLSLEITARGKDADASRGVIAKAIRDINIQDSVSIAEVILSGASISDATNVSAELASFHTSVRDRLADVEEAKRDLESKKVQSEKARRELLSLRTDLSARRAILDQSIKEQQALIAETQGKESVYKAKLADVQARKAAFERELSSFESQLGLVVDAGKLPSSGSGVLLWPLEKITVTQYFGNTSFATKNPQIYNGRGHTGVDFRASVGTRVTSALGGLVSGTGNTDLVRGCYSYGKWVLIKHPNGLSTLYAHLSLISVSEGQTVNAGQIIGYSGNTGYSTGPHLHFAVFATEGVRVQKFSSSVNCKNAEIPVADPKAYLNPLSYL